MQQIARVWQLAVQHANKRRPPETSLMSYMEVSAATKRHVTKLGRSAIKKKTVYIAEIIKKYVNINNVSNCHLSSLPAGKRRSRLSRVGRVGGVRSAHSFVAAVVHRSAWHPKQTWCGGVHFSNIFLLPLLLHSNHSWLVIFASLKICCLPTAA